MAHIYACAYVCVCLCVSCTRVLSPHLPMGNSLELDACGHTMREARVYLILLTNHHGAVGGVTHILIHTRAYTHTRTHARLCACGTIIHICAYHICTRVQKYPTARIYEITHPIVSMRAWVDDTRAYVLIYRVALP